MVAVADAGAGGVVGVWGAAGGVAGGDAGAAAVDVGVGALGDAARHA